MKMKKNLMTILALALVPLLMLMSVTGCSKSESPSVTVAETPVETPVKELSIDEYLAMTIEEGSVKSEIFTQIGKLLGSSIVGTPTWIEYMNAELDSLEASVLKTAEMEGVPSKYIPPHELEAKAGQEYLLFIDGLREAMVYDMDTAKVDEAFFHLEIATGYLEQATKLILEMK